MGAGLVLATAMATVYGRQQHQVTGGTAGLVLTYALQLPSNLMWLVRAFTSLETEFVSVERVIEYGELPPEDVDADNFNSDSATGDDSGPVDTATATAAAQLRVADLRVRYAPHLPWVLHGINVHVPAGSKVALCGRTGSGKSTLALSVLGMVPYQGTVVIGGTDVASESLSARRARVGALLQAGMLVQGRVRDTLAGPASTTTTDDALWAALDRVGMRAAIAAAPGGLNAIVEEGGRNFSAGERQLLALARLLLQPAPLVLADEGTSNCDEASDQIVHDTLLALPSTVVVICHRLTWLPRFDFVIVMDAGHVVDSGPYTPAMAARLQHARPSTHADA